MRTSFDAILVQNTGAGDDAEIGLDHGEVEAGEMIELQPRRIGEHRLQHRRGIVPPVEADEMLVAAAVGQLDQAQPVARRVEPHRLGVDRDRPGGEDIGGQVVFVQVNGHAAGA